MHDRHVQRLDRSQRLDGAERLAVLSARIIGWRPPDPHTARRRDRRSGR